MQEHRNTIFIVGVFVNATSVATMLEYNWYGQVSGTDTPTPAMMLPQQDDGCTTHGIQ